MKHNRVLLGFLAAVAAMMFLFCGDNIVKVPAGSGGQEPGTDIDNPQRYDHIFIITGNGPFNLDNKLAKSAASKHNNIAAVIAQIKKETDNFDVKKEIVIQFGKVDSVGVLNIADPITFDGNWSKISGVTFKGGLNGTINWKLLNIPYYTGGGNTWRLTGSIADAYSFVSGEDEAWLKSDGTGFILKPNGSVDIIVKANNSVLVRLDNQGTWSGDVLGQNPTFAITLNNADGTTTTLTYADLTDDYAKGPVPTLGGDLEKPVIGEITITRDWSGVQPPDITLTYDLSKGGTAHYLQTSTATKPTEGQFPAFQDPVETGYDYTEAAGVVTRTVHSYKPTDYPAGLDYIWILVIDNKGNRSEIKGKALPPNPAASLPAISKTSSLSDPVARETTDPTEATISVESSDDDLEIYYNIRIGNSSPLNASQIYNSETSIKFTGTPVTASNVSTYTIDLTNLPGGIPYVNVVAVRVVNNSPVFSTPLLFTVANYDDRAPALEPVLLNRNLSSAFASLNTGATNTYAATEKFLYYVASGTYSALSNKAAFDLGYGNASAALKGEITSVTSPFEIPLGVTNGSGTFGVYFLAVKDLNYTAQSYGEPEGFNVAALSTPAISAGSFGSRTSLTSAKIGFTFSNGGVKSDAYYKTSNDNTEIFTGVDEDALKLPTNGWGSLGSVSQPTASNQTVALTLAGAVEYIYVVVVNEMGLSNFQVIEAPAIAAAAISAATVGTRTADHKVSVNNVTFTNGGGTTARAWYRVSTATTLTFTDWNATEQAGWEDFGAVTSPFDITGIELADDAATNVFILIENDIAPIASSIYKVEIPLFDGNPRTLSATGSGTAVKKRYGDENFVVDITSTGAGVAYYVINDEATMTADEIFESTPTTVRKELHTFSSGSASGEKTISLTGVDAGDYIHIVINNPSGTGGKALSGVLNVAIPALPTSITSVTATSSFIEEDATTDPTNPVDEHFSINLGANFSGKAYYVIVTGTDPNHTTISAIISAATTGSTVTDFTGTAGTEVYDGDADYGSAPSKVYLVVELEVSNVTYYKIVDVTASP